MRILLFGGTSEGREISEYLYNRGFQFCVCVATNYAKDYLSKGIEIIEGRKTFEDIKYLISNGGYTLVLDATHPYADIVTRNIKSACDTLKVKYLRILREPQPLDKICVVVDSVQSAVEYLKSTNGNILLTTGVKNLKDFTQIEDYQERIFARILDNTQSIEESKTLGYNHIILNSGACDLDTNISHIWKSKAKYLVTKESGSVGGFLEKISACKVRGVIPVVISRPTDECGLTLKDTINYLDTLQNT
ncbi:MAG: precorrin-6A reductase [Oscillospiraceae bacterium]